MAVVEPFGEGLVNAFGLRGTPWDPVSVVTAFCDQRLPVIAAHRDGTALQVKLFPDIGPSDVHFWDDGDCQAGIEQLQLEDRGQFSDASTL